jgi:hypothetical protein
LQEYALVAIEEAISIYRGLIADRPETFHMSLADALEHLADVLTGLGRVAEATSARAEGAKVLRSRK